MNRVPTKIHIYNLYTDGNKLLGVGEEYALPSFDAMSEKVSGPGILGEIDMPTPGMFGSQEDELSFLCFDENAMNVIQVGSSKELTLRAAEQTESDIGTSDKGLRVVTRGLVKSIDLGKVKQGSPMDVKIKRELTYIMVESDGKTMLELDKLNGVYKVNGTDVLAKARSLA